MGYQIGKIKSNKRLPRILESLVLKYGKEKNKKNKK